MSLDQSANGTLPPPAPARPERKDNVPAAIFLMLGATFVFTCTSALSKWLIETYPIGEVLFSRVFIPLIGLAIIILPRTGLAVFRTTRLKGHLLRGASQSCSQTFLMIAFSLMPLASAVAINFSAPIFATLASIILLREHVGIARWSAILVGFFGVLIVTSPGTDTFTIGALFALANAVMYGTVTAGVRGLTATEFDPDAHALSDADHVGGVLADAAVRLRDADLDRRRLARPQRHRQRRGAILVDARAASGADVGGGAVPVFLADLGDDARLRDLGRRADRQPLDRRRDRRRLRAVPAVAGVAEGAREAALVPISTCRAPAASRPSPT